MRADVIVIDLDSLQNLRVHVLQPMRPIRERPTEVNTPKIPTPSYQSLRPILPTPVGRHPPLAGAGEQTHETVRAVVAASHRCSAQAAQGSVEVEEVVDLPLR